MKIKTQCQLCQGCMGGRWGLGVGLPAVPQVEPTLAQVVAGQPEMGFAGVTDTVHLPGGSRSRVCVPLVSPQTELLSL